LVQPEDVPPSCMTKDTVQGRIAPTVTGDALQVKPKFFVKLESNIVATATDLVSHFHFPPVKNRSDVRRPPSAYQLHSLTFLNIPSTLVYIHERCPLLA